LGKKTGHQQVFKVFHYQDYEWKGMGVNMLRIKNAKVFSPDNRFVQKDLWMNEGVIMGNDTTQEETSDVVDGTGCYAVPGLIDVHTHGAAGFDFMSVLPDSMDRLSLFYASHGVTGIIPTTITAPLEDTLHAVRNIRTALEKGTPGAQILGIHLEGPFINKKCKGAHDEEYITAPSAAVLQKLVEESGENIRLITLAPELEGMDELILAFAGSRITYSAGHSSLGYREGLEAFARGFSHVTHLFNAMPGIHHREPGLTGAALDDRNVTVEIIADGIHVHNAVLKLVTRCKPADKIVLISDSVMATGLQEGEYELGGQKINVSGGAARLENGTLAGSTLTMVDAVRNMVRIGVPLEQAITMASTVPARVIHADDCKGSLEAGMDADVVLLDEQLNVKMTIVGGRIVYQANAL
jgi:N-acetylglucosamine-6-phosphate deacetylase